MRTGWYKSQESMNGYKCIKHHDTKELNLVCLRGEIWENGPGKYKALVRTPNAYNKLRDLSVSTKFDSPGFGGESIFEFTQDQFQIVCSVLKPYKGRAVQVRKATLS